jgi:hypothetical protein
MFVRLMSFCGYDKHRRPTLQVHYLVAGRIADFVVESPMVGYYIHFCCFPSSTYVPAARSLGMSPPESYPKVHRFDRPFILCC